MPDQPATRARLGVFLLRLAVFFDAALVPIRVDQLRRIDARRHGDDAVAHDDDARGDDLSQRRLRRDVAKTHRGHGDDGPVDATRDAGEAVLRSLDQIHDGAENSGQRQHAEHEHKNLVLAARQRIEHLIRRAGVFHQLENSENTQHPESPDNRQMARPEKKQLQIRRQERQQIDDAEKAARIPPRVLHHGQPKHILQREGDGENPL